MISCQAATAELHWLPVEQHITYKLAVLAFKIRRTSTPAYLSRHIAARSHTRLLRSSSIPLLQTPFCRTSFGKQAFSTAAPSTSNSLPASVLDTDSLAVFKLNLNWKLTCSLLPVVDCNLVFCQRLWSYGTTALYKSILLLFYYYYY